MIYPKNDCNSMIHRLRTSITGKLFLLICFLPILNYIVLLFIFLIAMACAYEEAEIRTDKWLNKKRLNKTLLKWEKCEEDKLEEE